MLKNQELIVGVCYRSPTSSDNSLQSLLKNTTRCSAIAKRSRCRCVSFAQKWKTGTGWQARTFYGHYKSIFNHCDI